MTEEKKSNYKTIMTEDGSKTLYSALFQEACHSKTGAIEETHIHYIRGCRIKELAKIYDPLFILEVGFGAGVGFKETAKFFAKSQNKIMFFSFEIDLELIRLFEKNEGIQFVQVDNHYHYVHDNVELVVLQGDARKEIKKLIAKKNRFHAIYQDAFSPKRNSSLWTKQWFEDLYLVSHPKALMSTYSASSSIRKAMLAAGWKLSTGEKFGPKRSSTRAKKTGETQQDILKKLERSPAITLTDENYKTYKL
ncbi:MAG: MnmC family methyltransferase [Bacteriovoracaceae bacterium]|jgi:chorismate dehydratase|nr:MnmC family methyltransferase [Bacteriovoracaceae bacterium]